MASTDLEIFVRDSLARGSSRDTIAATLGNAGWSQAQVTRALGAWADVDSVVPVPKPRASLSAREAFFYLLMFAALYLAAWHLCSLFFDILNRAMPDIADAESMRYDFGGGSSRSMRWSTATLIVTLPVFLWMARIVARTLSRDPLARLSPVRRWLTYLTLFLASVTLICDTVTMVSNLLAGDLTLRFVFKVLIVAVVAGSIFTYYLVDLRRGEDA